MKPIRIRIASWRQAWRGACKKMAPGCGYRCLRGTSLWRRLGHGHRVVRLQGQLYRHPECLESALVEVVGRLRSTSNRAGVPTHRVPLGLLLLSRAQLTAEQLSTGLAAQRAAGRGKLGEWLQELGFVSEPQITAALARQWACPVLRTTPNTSRIPALPQLLLESFGMVPVDFVEAKATLYVAFSERIDYTVLYAIQQMLGCHTEPCLISPEMLRRTLVAQAPGRQAIVFEHLVDAFELARIVRNYATQSHAVEVRMALCGSYIWTRLQCPLNTALDLVLRTPADPWGIPA
jgi:hypothetical protein